MVTAAKLLAEAMLLSDDEREELAAKLLGSLEPPTGRASCADPRASARRGLFAR